MKFGYLGQSEQIVESELITRYKAEDKGKWIIGYYTGSPIPMIGFLDYSGSNMRVQLYKGTHYQIKGYRLLGDKIGRIIESDATY